VREARKRDIGDMAFLSTRVSQKFVIIVRMMNLLRKISFYIICSCLFCVFGAQYVCAEALYHCGNLWSSSPCEEGTQALPSLPSVGRVPASAGKGAEVEALASTSPTPQAEACVLKADGLDIRILSYRVERHFDTRSDARCTDNTMERCRVDRSTRQNFLILSVKNYSAIALKGPLFGELKNGNEQKRVQITENLGAQEEFTKDIFLGEETTGKIDFTLAYSPAKACPKIEVDVKAAAVRVDSEAVDYVVDVKAFEKVKLKNLETLNSDIANLHKSGRRQFNASTTPDTATEYVKMHERWEKLCGEFPQSTLRVKNECRKSLEKLRRAKNY
jgi:hypothetical protein